MANIPYFYNPTAFPAQQNVAPAPAPAPSHNSIVWVQGEVGAKAYPVAPGSSVLLMDSEEAVMYIKSTDNSGMPLPLRVFDYTERTAQAKADTQAPVIEITRQEFDELRAEVRKLMKSAPKTTTKGE